MPDLSSLAKKWPSAFVARSEVGRFTGGLVSPGTMANLDSKGIGPKGRVRVGRKVAYEIYSFVEWLESRATGGTRQAIARKEKPHGA